MIENRPNHDQFLARVRGEATRPPRGKLKIFFGYAAGVGKTYAMLEAAHRENADGVDVVVGYRMRTASMCCESCENGFEPQSLFYPRETKRIKRSHHWTMAPTTI